VSFAAITLCVASQRVFVVVYFVTDPDRKLLNTLSYISVVHDGSMYITKYMEHSPS
jgi:hypothetical protein